MNRQISPRLVPKEEIREEVFAGDWRTRRYNLSDAVPQIMFIYVINTDAQSLGPTPRQERAERHRLGPHRSGGWWVSRARDHTNGEFALSLRAKGPRPRSQRKW
jgi:hypothetical protein